MACVRSEEVAWIGGLWIRLGTFSSRRWRLLGLEGACSAFGTATDNGVEVCSLTLILTALALPSCPSSSFERLADSLCGKQKQISIGMILRRLASQPPAPEVHVVKEVDLVKSSWVEPEDEDELA